MEILRFDAEPTPARKSRRPIKGVFVVGLVAATFGIGSAFATSTIAINGDNTVQLGQGVTAVTACDTAISVVPQSAMRALGNPESEVSVSPSATPLADVFTVGSIEVGKNQQIAPACAGKVFKIQIYNYDGASSTALSCSDIDGSGVTGDYSNYVCNGDAFYVQFSPDASGEANNFTIDLKDGLLGDQVDYITLETTASPF